MISSCLPLRSSSPCPCPTIQCFGIGTRAPLRPSSPAPGGLPYLQVAALWSPDPERSRDGMHRRAARRRAASWYRASGRRSCAAPTEAGSMQHSPGRTHQPAVVGAPDQAVQPLQVAAGLRHGHRRIRIPQHLEVVAVQRGEGVGFVKKRLLCAGSGPAPAARPGTSSAAYTWWRRPPGPAATCYRAHASNSGQLRQGLRTTTGCSRLHSSDANSTAREAATPSRTTVLRPAPRSKVRMKTSVSVNSGVEGNVAPIGSIGVSGQARADGHEFGLVVGVVEDSDQV